MRYVDTKPNGEALRKCILQGPYKLSTVIIPGQPATDESPEVEEQTILETFSNISPENKAHYDAEKEAIHFILTRIGYDIYSIVDVFTSRDGESIESYYSRFYKMMNEMVRNQLEVATMQVNVQFLQQLQPEWSGFMTVVKQTVDLDKESYHKLFDILKQYQKKVNKIHAKKIAKNANPFALVAAAQQYPDTYYQAPKPHKSYGPPSKKSSSTRSYVSTKHKGKKISKLITPPSESAFEEDTLQTYQQQSQNFFKLQEQECGYYSTIREWKSDWAVGNQRTITVAGPKETVGKQADWLEDTDKEVDEQELEAHYMYMKKIQEVHTIDSRPSFNAEPLEKVHSNDDYNMFANERQHSEKHVSINNTCVVEKVDSNVIPDSSDMCDNDNQVDQNAKECDDERVVLANLIANLKLDTDENKKIHKQLNKANASLYHELQECKSALEECKSSLENSNRTRDRCIIALQNKKIELEKYKTYHDRTIEHDILERKLKDTL
ncbi:hypothetical protein Tco_0922700 [Tanacetum coccineum]|uniref:Uncharacterized protein n=1 Tax=Tanacetum coccineum TaxID=301880 RepID=A0ABQ5D268_9ASTR